VSGLVGVTGLIVGIEHLFDAEFGIDNLMWGERVLLSGFAHPGRPSVQTTISVLLVAIGIVAYAVQRDRRIGVAGALGVVAGYIALEALLGYAFGIEAFYSSVGLGAGAMSVPTALAVLFASVGLLLYPLADVWPELTSDRLSWRMMWRLLPVVLAAPIINVLAQGLTLTRGPGVEFLSSLVGAAILGIMVGVVWSVGRDVRRLSFRREEAMAEAERASHAKSEFLSNMSHELRTPLNSVIGFAQLLELGDLDERSSQSVDSILRAGRHLLELINDILDLSRIEAGSLQMSTEPVILDEVIAEAMRLVEPMAAAAEVTLMTKPGASDQHVLADRKRLLQVLLNLLSNAVNYNQRNGGITVWWEKPSDGLVKVGVTDQGIGIKPEHQALLFNPFERLEAQSSGVEGVGIGLALSQRLMRAMESELKVTSVPGEGSTFWCQLLEAEGGVKRYERLASKDQPLTGRRDFAVPRTILYIEDNVANLALVERILEEFDRPYRVIPAMQGRMGVDLAREHLPDLILLDLHLPDIAGEEVMTQLREGAPTASIPVVVISADVTPGRLSRLMEAGANAQLSKPIEAMDLIKVIDDLTNTNNHGSPRVERT
jgi:signal transduction histidine kinase/CheY-like chemotaxis protein